MIVSHPQQKSWEKQMWLGILFSPQFRQSHVHLSEFLQLIRRPSTVRYKNYLTAEKYPTALARTVLRTNSGQEGWNGPYGH